MKKQLLFLILIFFPMLANADRIKIDGIYYNLDTYYKTACVTNDGVNYIDSNPKYYSGDVVIPEKISYEEVEYSVTSIDNSAFSRCSSLTSITIPNSVTSIGGNAFYGCSGLTSITIPNSVTSIGHAAFTDCAGLTSIIVEAGNPNFDSRNNCNAIIETASNTLIAGCMNTTIPNSVASIGSSAFSGCTGLTSITIPNSVTSIDEYAFSHCSSLTSIIVEAGNPNFDSRNNCNAIIETSSNTLLYGCMNTTIPNSVTSIGSRAFEGCTDLTSITIPNSVTSIGSCAFYECSGLTSITIPNSVTSIGSCAFIRCTGLTSITIPNSLTSIVSQAFMGCTGLTSVTIPNCVTKIGYEAFKDCVNLALVTCQNPVPPTCDIRAFNTFTASLYVPAGSVIQYKAADIWRNFVIIREISDEDNDIYLTINDGAHGNVKLRIDKENPYMTMKLEAESGWHVHSVTLNGDNVTAEVASDGTYTTPAINSNSLLSVVYAQGSTSAPSLEVSNLYLHTAGNTLYINGTKGDEQVSVLTLDGKCVVSQQATSGLTEIVLDGHQTYIVKVGQETFKLQMK